MLIPEFSTLLADLAAAFGEPVTWQGVTFPGRFRIDPFVVGLPMTGQGIGTTETWLHCEQAAIPGPAPDIGAVLMIRGRAWEIVEVGEDDLGELAIRLIPHGDVPAAESEETGRTEFRRPGRPSRREEIERAWTQVAPTLDPAAPLAHAFPAVRKAITGQEAPTPGLGDKTIGKALRPLVAVRRRD